MFTRTMKWHKQPDLTVLNPLSDAVPCAPLDSSNERGVVDDAVEDLARRRHRCLHVRLGVVLGDGALASVAAAHLAGGAWCLRQSCENASVWMRARRERLGDCMGARMLSIGISC